MFELTASSLFYLVQKYLQQASYRCLDILYMYILYTKPGYTIIACGLLFPPTVRIPVTRISLI